MSPSNVPELGGKIATLPRGSLTISKARDLRAIRLRPNAFEADGTAARDTLRFLDETPMVKGGKPDELTGETVDVHEEEVIWGGQIMAGYGHFLCESVARLWPLIEGGEMEGLPAVFTAERDWPRSEEPSFVREWLGAFGAACVELPASGVTRFRRMIVPEPSWRLGAWIAPEARDIHLQARRGMNVPARSGGGVTWLSRGRLHPHRIPYDEALLEWILGEHVSVVAPETLALPEQIATLEGSRAVAGVVGSAFHTLLTTATPPDCLYLCPPWGGAAHMAQHRFLDCDAVFAQALSPIWTPHTRRRGIVFPFGYRLSIPKVLRALDETVLPGLLEDSRLAALAEPARHWSSTATALDGDLDAAVARVLLDPASSEARTALGLALELDGLTHLALEQFMAAGDLNEGCSEGALRAGRLLAYEGRAEDALAMAKRTLDESRS